MEWTKKDSASTIIEVVERNTKMNIQDFLNPEKDPYLTGLNETVDFIKNEISKGTAISIIGDYDCDGITSSTILSLAFTEASGKEPFVRIPRRFSEGYGLSMKIIDEINEGLIVTVDNGIAAIEQVKEAKKKGLKVVVIDHHLPVKNEKGEVVLPDADVILDPHAIPGSSFSDYCGAGLAYRVAKLLIPNNPLLTPLCALASIGTVADVMPLVGDNRNIVINGMAAVNSRNITTGLHLLLEELGIEWVSEGDYGFKLGPVMNAAGRLLDDGPIDVVNVLKTNFDPTDMHNAIALDDLHEQVKTLVKNNEKRRELVRSSMLEADELMKKEVLRRPIVLYNPNFSEGIIGIIAGQLAEQYQTPAIVFTDTKTEGILKGSGRTYGNVHLKDLLDSVSQYLLGYGGHAGAAGLSVKYEDLYDFKIALNGKLKDVDFGVDAEHLSYDLEIPLSDVASSLKELDKYAPFGEGNPQIRFKVTGFECSPVNGKFSKPMGPHMEHIRFYGKDVSAVGFDLAKRYQSDGEPKIMDFVGMLGNNYFKGRAYNQIEVIDYKKKEKEKTKLNQSLEDLLIFT